VTSASGRTRSPSCDVNGGMRSGSSSRSAAISDGDIVVIGSSTSTVTVRTGPMFTVVVTSSVLSSIPSCRCSKIPLCRCRCSGRCSFSGRSRSLP
jgi:hypothetical protein